MLQRSKIHSNLQGDRKAKFTEKTKCFKSAKKTKNLYMPYYSPFWVLKQCKSNFENKELKNNYFNRKPFKYLHNVLVQLSICSAQIVEYTRLFF